MLFGIVGSEWGGFTAAEVVEDLHSLEDDQKDPIRVLITSPGGDFFEGVTIYSELKKAGAPVVVEIPAVAASAGSLIAMAGTTIRMHKNAHMMIHDPWTSRAGNADQLRRAADLLDRFGTSMASVYSERTGIPEDELTEMMGRNDGEGTWLTAEEAVEAGFADEIVEEVDGALETAAFARVDISELENVPTRLVAMIRQCRAQARENAPEPSGNRRTPTRRQTMAPKTEGNELTAEQIQAQIDTAVTAAVEAKDEAAKNRITEIRGLAEKYELGDAWALGHITSEAPVETVRANVIDELFARQKAQPGPRDGGGHGVRVGEDERDRWLQGAEAWLMVKSGNAGLIQEHTGERPDAGEFRGLSLLDLARDVVERSGVSVRGKTPMEVARLALMPRAEAGLGTRSDFPVLLENALHKLLLAAYETAPDQWRAIAAVGSVQDFREHPRYRLGSLPRLAEKLESGEFRQMHFPDAEKEVIQAATYGNIIGLSRQAIVNDDMDGFSRLITMLGRAAARSIEIDLFALLAANSGLGPTMRNGKTLFHADHDNIAATAGEPSVATLSAARTLMAKQKDPNGNDYLNLRPVVWVGPIELGDTVRVVTEAQYDFAAQTSGNTGQFQKPNAVRGMISTIVDTPRLSGDRWYVLADPAIAPALEVAFLQGQENPLIEPEEGFEYDGVRWRVLHDYGVAGTDHRPAVTNAGA